MADHPDPCCCCQSHNRLQPDARPFQGCYSTTPFQRQLCMRRLLVDCNQLAVDIDSELSLVHNWVSCLCSCIVRHQRLLLCRCGSGRPRCPSPHQLLPPLMAQQPMLCRLNALNPKPCGAARPLQTTLLRSYSPGTTSNRCCELAHTNRMPYMRQDGGTLSRLASSVCP